MQQDRTRSDIARGRGPEDAELFRPVELLAKLFEGPEGGGSGLEALLARLEWKETTR
ncbi:hypothetical protein [Oceanicola sp. S124]|uniref:hypothetical protein n=1 Tax=Oceanicola sp. S124 TaxID=1042378 RepID=UPI000302E815|nr:hypothetical protein [Oceanicola sp. S124]